MIKFTIEKDAIAQHCFEKAIAIEKATKHSKHQVDSDAYEMLLHHSSSLCASFRLLTASCPFEAALQIIQDANRTLLAIDDESHSESE